MVLLLLSFTATVLPSELLSSRFLDNVGPLELENARLGNRVIQVPSILDVVQPSTKYQTH